MPQTSLSANGSLMLSMPQTLRPGRKRFKRGDAGRRQEEAPQQESAWRLAGACEWLDAQCDAEGPFFMGPIVRLCALIRLPALRSACAAPVRGFLISGGGEASEAVAEACDGSPLPSRDYSMTTFNVPDSDLAIGGTRRHRSRCLPPAV